jgi:hypothetical protein
MMNQCNRILKYNINPRQIWVINGRCRWAQQVSKAAGIMERKEQKEQMRNEGTDMSGKPNQILDVVSDDSFADKKNIYLTFFR